MEARTNQAANKSPSLRSPEEWDLIYPRYPETPDGYVQSFSPDEEDKYIPVLEKYGVVVIQAIPPELCDDTVDGMIAEVNQMQRPDVATEPVKLSDSSTWGSENWPAGNKFLFDKPTVCPAAWKIRLHPNIQQIFAALYGPKQRLVSSVDKWLFARGTRNVALQNPETGETEQRERIMEWEQYLRLHVHLDPWRYRQEQQKARWTNGAAGGTDRDVASYVQSLMAVVALVDCPREVGGHVTLPGGTQFLDTWAKENKMPSKLQNNYYTDNKHLRSYKQKIPLRKGEIVIWDLRQFHGTFTNTSSLPRVAQFVRYIPADIWFQQTDRLSPATVYKKWPELKAETQKVLKDLDCTREELCLAGVLPWGEAV